MQLVLQGPLRADSEDVVRHYLAWEAVERIVVSCWESCRPLDLHDHRVVVVRSKPLHFAGINNVNRQIVSSRNGLALVTSRYAAKLRIDQVIAIASLRRMDECFWRNAAEPCPIFVAGNYTRFPFHPRDHVFWGRTEDLVQLFDLPLCPDPFVASPDFTRSLRPEAWIGAHYCARKDRRVARFLADPQTFLTDGAPRIAEALLVHDQLRERVFRTFPRIDLRWPKYGLEAYDYATCATLSEYWAESG